MFEYIHFASPTEIDINQLKEDIVNSGMEQVEIIQLKANIEDSFMDLMAKAKK